MPHSGGYDPPGVRPGCRNDGFGPVLCRHVHQHHLPTHLGYRGHCRCCPRPGDWPRPCRFRNLYGPLCGIRRHKRGRYGGNCQNSAPLYRNGGLRGHGPAYDRRFHRLCPYGWRHRKPGRRQLLLPVRPWRGNGCRRVPVPYPGRTDYADLCPGRPVRPDRPGRRRGRPPIRLPDPAYRRRRHPGGIIYAGQRKLLPRPDRQDRSDHLYHLSCTSPAGRYNSGRPVRGYYRHRRRPGSGHLHHFKQRHR